MFTNIFHAFSFKLFAFLRYFITYKCTSVKNLLILNAASKPCLIVGYHVYVPSLFTFKKIFNLFLIMFNIILSICNIINYHYYLILLIYTYRAFLYKIQSALILHNHLAIFLPLSYY